MANLGNIISTAKRTLSILEMLEPIIGDDAPFVKDVLAVASKVLAGASSGKVAYETLVAELEELNAEMDAIRARGPVTGDDIREEVAAVASRGQRLDALLAQLES